MFEKSFGSASFFYVKEGKKMREINAVVGDQGRGYPYILHV